LTNSQRGGGGGAQARATVTVQKVIWGSPKKGLSTVYQGLGAAWKSRGSPGQLQGEDKKVWTEKRDGRQNDGTRVRSLKEKATFLAERNKEAMSPPGNLPRSNPSVWSVREPTGSRSGLRWKHISLREDQEGGRTLWELREKTKNRKGWVSQKKRTANL